LWLQIDWIGGRKLFSIDDAYRYFVAKNAFQLPSAFLWNYVLPAALLFDATVAELSSGSLMVMRLSHAAVGILTLAVIARASLRSGCGPALAFASILIVGLMPLYVVISSSFYGEGLFGLLLAIAFLLLIEERSTPLAITVALMPLVRPEGVIYCVLFMVYFGLRRDAWRCALVALPGSVYLAVLFSGPGEWMSFLEWRLELRKILSPAMELHAGRGFTLDRLPNPLWAGLALSSLLIRRFRKWWPILLGPWVLVLMQASTISNSLQDFELRYLFSVIPVFAIAWAFPIRHLLDEASGALIRRRMIAALACGAILTITASHMLQSDVIRDYFVDRKNSERTRGEISLRFDPRPLRAFAARVDAYLEAHKEIDTVFISTSAPLYFLDFPKHVSHIESVLIPHNATTASYSGGRFYGISLTTLAYRYFIFDPAEPGQSAPAMLIVMDSGQSPFAHSGSGSGRVAAKIQSGSMQAFAVRYSSQNSVEWSFPARAVAPQ
jgi:hypothetical protein